MSGAVLERLDAADVEADRGVELQRPATGGGLGRAEHHADLLAQLVDEDRGGAGLLRHRSSCAAPGSSAGPAGRRGCRPSRPRSRRGARARHRVDDDRVERAGADQHVGDLQRLLAGVRAGTPAARRCRRRGSWRTRVERVLGVDERGDAAGRLGVATALQGDRGLAGDSGRKISTTRPAAGHRCRARRPGRSTRSG